MIVIESDSAREKWIMHALRKLFPARVAGQQPERRILGIVFVGQGERLEREVQRRFPGTEGERALGPFRERLSGRLALGGLVLVTAWSALSVTWAPVRGATSPTVER